MGGRGRSSGAGFRQMTIDDAQRQHAISDIIRESTKLREAIGGGVGGGAASPQLYKKCACCGEYTIPMGSEYEMCPACGWIDDNYQNNHPDSLDGKNPVSLLQAKTTYQKKQNQ